MKFLPNFYLNLTHFHDFCTTNAFQHSKYLKSFFSEYRSGTALLFCQSMVKILYVNV